MKTRIGPSMNEALEFIKHNPGCSQSEASNAVSASGDNHEVVRRLVRNNLVRREPVLTDDGFLKAYKLYIVE